MHQLFISLMAIVPIQRWLMEVASSKRNQRSISLSCLIVNLSLILSFLSDIWYVHLFLFPVWSSICTSISILIVNLCINLSFLYNSPSVHQSTKSSLHPLSLCHSRIFISSRKSEFSKKKRKKKKEKLLAKIKEKYMQLRHSCITYFIKKIRIQPKMLSHVWWMIAWWWHESCHALFGFF